MKKQTLILLIALIATIACGADQITFKTSQPAPTGFTAWTFYWTMPEIEPGAILQYVVLQPDGKEYFRFTITGEHPAGQQIRSDFSKDFAGGDPKVFYGESISFTFIVDKGKIKFPENPPFRFEFRNLIPAIKEK